MLKREDMVPCSEECCRCFDAAFKDIYDLKAMLVLSVFVNVLLGAVVLLS